MIDTFPNGFMVASTWQATNAAFSSANGIGWYYASTTNPAASVRGGYWSNLANAGVFSLLLSNGVSSTGTNIGFRCAYQ